MDLDATLKAFCGIKFSDNSHEVVPKAWLMKSKKKLKCLWPPNNDLSKVRARASKGMPAEDDWQPLSVTLLTQSSK